jgi:hypothetical protein
MVVTAIFAPLLPAAYAGGRTDSLREALKGADRLLVEDVEPRPPGDRAKPFEYKDAAKIATLVNGLDFVETKGAFECMCLGDSKVTFFKGKQKLATLSHHHGRSLRWNKGKWEGDSLFTDEAAKLWREWFKAQGEPRFDQMHQAALAEAKREQELHEGFMKAMPPSARPIFDAAANAQLTTFEPQDVSKAPQGSLSPAARKLVALFPTGSELATALARSLGSLAIAGADLGAWTVSSSREQLVIECAKTVKAGDFQTVLESSDDEVLVGAARLFFFEDLAEIVPKDKRGPYAAKLCEEVLRRDRCRNGDSAVRAMGHFSCAETLDLLERLARGDVPIAARANSSKDEPSPRAAACLLLAKAGVGHVADLTREVEKSGKLDEFDKAALRIARSLSGERGLLKKSVFKINSYTVGFGALAALEKEGGKEALDAVINGATEHSWAAVREEAVLTVERMTGKKWFQNQENERAEWHGKDIRDWWQKNRDTYRPKSNGAANSRAIESQ